MSKFLLKIVGFLSFAAVITSFVLIMVFSFSSLKDKESSITLPEEQYILNKLANNYEDILFEKRNSLELERNRLLHQRDMASGNEEKLTIETKLRELTDQKDSINKKISDYNVEKKKMEADIKDMKEQLKSKDRIIAELTKKNFNLTIENEKNSKSLNEYVTSVKIAIEKIYKNAPDKLNTINMEFYRDNGKTYIINEIQNLNNQLSDINSMIEKYKNDKSNNNYANIELENKIKSLEDEIQKNNSLNKDVIDYLETKNEKNRDAMISQHFFLTIYKKIYDDNNKKIEEINSLNSKLAGLKKEMESATANLLLLKGNYDKLSITLDEKLKEIETLKAMAKNQNTQNIDKDTNELLEAKNKIEILENNIKNINAEMTVIKEKYDAALLQIEEKNKNIALLKNELENTTKSNQNTSDIEILRKEKEDIENELIALKNKFIILENSNKKISDYLETKNQKPTIGQFFEDFVINNFKILFDSLGKKEKEILDLKETSLSDKENISQSKALEFDKIKNENKDLKDRITQLENRINLLESANNEITNYLSGRNEKIDDKENPGTFFLNHFIAMYDTLENNKKEITKLNDSITQIKKEIEKFKDVIAKREKLFIKEREFLFTIANINGLFSEDNGKIYVVTSSEKESEILKKGIFQVYDKDKKPISKIQITKEDNNILITKYPGFKAPMAGTWF